MKIFKRGSMMHEHCQQQASAEVKEGWDERNTFFLHMLKMF
jgi:hypothetical protein